MAGADRLIEIFNEAKARPAGAERAGFLAESCGADEELNAQVLSLLGAHEGAGEFLQSPPALSPEIEAELARLKPEETGERIGPYKLREQIGEGGFGVVWVAEQQEPVRRTVALKIIKMGMDTKEVVARFEQERQALAMMDHPNIARVFDAGATEHGRPFFVMELVRGIKITDYCDQANLPTAERLALFMTVCQAVQHAHQKGIIHRDLKPSNILVTLHDGVAVPKVIDFGVAKATQLQRLTDLTIYTQFEQMIGTPLYMSPEQAEMSGLDVDTRSDIYSLGVLLYELLTGRTPFDPEELMRKGLDEIRRTIREQEPQTPSMFVRTLALDARTQVAQHRKTDGAKLEGLIRGDLDWIVMKAIEKDRTRRYETATGLASDIQRHLNNEAVLAGPPTITYRLGKMLRKHRTAVSVAAAFVLLLASAAGVSTWLAVRASRDRADALRAEGNAIQARAGAEQDAAAANRERGNAERAERAAKDTLAQTQIQRAEDFFTADDPARAIAHLASVLTSDPSNHVAAERLLSALSLRSFSLPSFEPLRFESEVYSGQFSPDGLRVVTACMDKTARVWDVQTGKPLTEPLRHDMAVAIAKFSPDGLRVVTASWDKTARVWDAQTGVALTGPLRHQDLIQSVQFSGDGLQVVTTSRDKTAQLWDVRTGNPIGEPLRHDGVVNRALFSPDGLRVLTTSWDKTARVWDARTGRAITKPLRHNDDIRSAQFSPDGLRVITGSYGEKTVRVWDAQTGKPLTTPLQDSISGVTKGQFSEGLRLVINTSSRTARVWDAATGQLLVETDPHEATINFSTFSPDGLRILTGSVDKTARIWDARTGKALFAPLRHESEVLVGGFSPNGVQVLTLDNRTARVWDAQPGKSFTEPLRHAGPVRAAQFSPDGLRIVTASDKTAQIWDALTARALAEPMRHEGSIHFAEFSPDGLRVVTTSEDNPARIWDAQTGKPLTDPLRHETGRYASRVFNAHFSPDGLRIVTSSQDQTARIWDAQTGKPLAEPLRHLGAVYSAEFSPDGLRVVTASDDMTARVWDAQTGKPLTDPLRHEEVMSSFMGIPSGLVYSAHFSRDGLRVLTASADYTARVWDAQSGESLIEPLRHEAEINSARFSPDDSRVVTASWDATARVWDARTGRPLTESLRHQAALASARFSPDGLRVATSSQDHTARVWDAQTGKPLTEPLRHEGAVNDAQFSPDGLRLLTTSEDNTTRVWEVPIAPMIAPAWLARLAVIVGGKRLTDSSVLEPVGPEEFLKLKKELSLVPATDFYTRWAKWFCSDRATRTISPFAAITVPQYVEHQIQEGTIESLGEAERLAGGNVEFLRRIAERRKRIEQN